MVRILICAWYLTDLVRVLSLVVEGRGAVALTLILLSTAIARKGVSLVTAYVS